MEDFITTYEVKGYAKFDKYQNVIMIQGKTIPYEEIDCFEFEEKIEVGTEPDLVKEVHSYVFAVVIPLTTLLDENSTRRGIYVCSSLKTTIWLKGKDEPITIPFLPKEKLYKVDAEPFQTYRLSFIALKDALTNVMIKLYGNDAQKILEKNLRIRKNEPYKEDPLHINH